MAAFNDTGDAFLRSVLHPVPRFQSFQPAPKARGMHQPQQTSRGTLGTFHGLHGIAQPHLSPTHHFGPLQTLLRLPCV